VTGRDFVAFDLETTGFIPGVDEIIEIGAVKVLDGQVVERFETLVRCRGIVPAPIERLTGIKGEDLLSEPFIEEALPRFLAFVEDHPLVAHNASFDVGFLVAACGRHLTQECIDTVEFAKLCFPLAPNFRLEGLAAHLDLGEGNFHRALNDAEIAGKLALLCLERAESWDLGLVRQLNLLLEKTSSGVAGLLRQVEKKLTRSFPDRLIRESYLYLSSDNSPTGLFYRSPQKEKRAELDPAEIAELLGPNGPLAQRVPNYQHRPGQLRMLKGVLKAFSTDSHLVVEAGTGTGKSLAYLVPAVCWATAREEKVAIATHTINLQEQLWEKDIPLLRSFLPMKFEAALVKGRNNYLCLRKWQGLWSDLDNLRPEERMELAAVLTWLSETVSGDRAELSLRGRGQELWTRFAADSESCLGSRCKFFSGACFVMRARRKAENADVLILNHSLLLSDIKTDNKVLPSYNYLVIDEAHHLEESATEHLGNSISDSRLEFLLRLLRPGGSPPGLIGQVKHRLHGLSGRLSEENLERLEQAADKTVELLGMVQESSQEFFRSLTALARDLGGNGTGLLQVRLKPVAVDWSAWPALCSARENLTLRLLSLAETLQAMSRVLEEPEEENLAGLVRDLQSMAVLAREVGESAAELMDINHANQVVWVETDERTCRLCGAPVEVGTLLRDQLFARVKAGILTSATISVNNSFDHFVGRVGLDEKTFTLQVESPFHYEDQALLCIPRDLPDPAKVGDEQYLASVSQFLIDLVRTVGGRTLVLFTAHKMLREVYAQIKPFLEADDLQVLGHNLDGGRGKLVEEFKANPRSVLLGASSFWEGVDIQGQALSCVVIVRLPFWPPTIPTLEARMEVLAKQNKDGFRHLSIPQAVIRLKQGFGRLIRTKEDRGVVVVLDNRLLDKNYGRKFLNSLPLKTHFRGDTELVLRKIASWLDNKTQSTAWRLLVKSGSEVDAAVKDTKLPH